MITVAEYKRPKFEITFNPLKDAYKLGDQLTVSGIAKTYSGVNIEIARLPIPYKLVLLIGASRKYDCNRKTQTNAKGEFEILSKRKNRNTPTIYERIRNLHSFRHD